MVVVDHVIYLHGRNGKRRDDKWLRHGLEPLLALLDFGSLGDAAVQVHRPHYTDLIDAVPPSTQYPPVLERQEASPSDAARARYGDRLAQLRAQRGQRPAEGALGAIHRRVPADVAASAVIRPHMPDVHRYITSDATRRAVQTRIREQVPTAGSAVVIAHSLGTVIALDFLHFLPPELRVRCLLTLGSPLALKSVRKELKGAGFNWPCEHLESWVNLYDPADRVTAGRPLEPKFVDEVLDVQVDNHTEQTHSAVRYLSHGTVVRMLGRHLSTATTGPLPKDVDPSVLQACLVRAFARRIEAETAPGSQRRARMARARQITETSLLEQARVVDPRVDSLALDLSGVAERLGAVPTRLSNLAALYFANPFEPFDVEYREHELREGLRALGLELGISNRKINTLFRSLGEASSIFDEGGNWKKYAIGAGAAALLVAAPYAVVALGATGGLAGGAAIASGLAAVGGTVGGGMVAGIGLVGTVTAGGAASATLAVSRMKTETLQAELVRALALSRCEQLLSIGSNGRQGLEGLIEVKRGLEELSDHQSFVCGPKSKAVSSLRGRLDTVDQSIEWLRQKGIGADDA